MRPSNRDEERAALSPSLVGEGETTPPAYEQKFRVDEAAAQAIVAAVRPSMQPDPHADAGDGAYLVTTLYLDTPRFDVFHEAPELEGAKYRVRRYGREAGVWLEKKVRRGNRVWKRRSAAPLETPERGSSWFHDEVRARDFQPTLAVSYRRTAFFGSGDAGGFRLTFDRAILGTPRAAWDLAVVTEGTRIEPERIICEFKFRETLPGLFKRLIADLALTPVKFSKYRRLLVATGVVAKGPSDAS